MTWFNVDDGTKDASWVLSIPRAHRNACVGIWTRCGAWSANQLTDGFIPDEIATGIASEDEIRYLVEAGKWATVPERMGWQMADWQPGNRLREQVLADREAAKTRMSRHRAGSAARSPERSSEPTDERAPFVLEGQGESLRTESPSRTNGARSPERPLRPVPPAKPETRRAVIAQALAIASPDD